MTAASNAVVVLGGGPAGCAAAIAARRRGLGPVFVVERGSYEEDRVGESIPPDTRVLLERLGLREAFDAQQHESCLGSCSSWGADALGFNDFVLNPHGAGFHLDRRRFEQFMARSAIEAGARVLTKTRFTSATRVTGGAGFVLNLEGESRSHRIVAPFVIDATGSSARFARSCGAERLVHDQMFCATAYFHLREGASFSQLTLLEAVRDGWWYAARLPNHRVAVAFACDASLLKSHSVHAEEPWLNELGATRHLAPALRECFLIPKSLRVCPIPCFVLDRAAGDGWVAVGDAATAFDPLSARGIHKALATGIDAAEAIAAAAAGDASATRRYSEGTRAMFDAYVGQRDTFYARETRWPDAPFWQARRGRRWIAQALEAQP